MKPPGDPTYPPEPAWHRKERESMTTKSSFIPIYAVYETTNEYGHHGACVGYFTDHEAAKAAAVGKGWYGGEGKVVSEYAIEHEGRHYLLALPRSIDIDANPVARATRVRKQALAKLSKEEIEALGLKDAG